LPSPLGKMAKLRCFAGDKLFRGFDHGVVLQDVEGGAIGHLRLPIAPLPERAQDRASLRRQGAAAGDTPGFIRIALAGDESLLERALARLPEPFHPAKRLHLLFHFRSEREEKMRVVLGIDFHRGRERTARPVGFLRTLGQDDVEVLLDERGITELAQANHPGRDHGVENFPHRQIKAASQQAQIKIHSLENNLLVCEQRAERLEIDSGERIDQNIFAVEGELNEAELFEIAVQTVGLGVDRDALEMTQAGKKPLELCVGSDHRRPASKSSALVLVACRFLISNSIASSGGMVAISLRRIFTRSHSSG